MGNKTKEQLIEEIESLRKEAAEAKQEKAGRARTEEVLQAYESMVESAHDAIFFKNLDSCYVMANAKTLEAFGLSREEVIGKNDRELMTNQEEAKKNIEDDQLVFKTKKPTEVTKHMTGADGKGYWFQAIKVPQFDRKRNIMGLVGIARDITERKRAEEEVEESKELYRALVEAGADMGEAIVLLQNRDKVEAAHLFANQEWVRMTGYSVEELREISYFDLIHPRHRDGVANRVRRRFRGEFLPGRWQISIMARDGTELRVEATGATLTYQGRPAVVAYIRDITERKRAEEAVRESERRYRTLFESKLEGMFVIDAETMQIVLANQAAADMYGFSSVEEGIGVNPLDFVASEEGERVLKIMVEDMFEKDLQEINEFRTKTKDGKEKWISAVGARIEYEGKLAGLVSFRDITERKNREEQLVRLSNAVKMSTDSIVMSDLEGNIIEANEATLKLYGADDKRDLIGKNSFDLIAPEDREKAFAGMEEVRKRGYTEGREYRIITKDGSRVPVEMTAAIMKDVDGKAIGFVGVSRDITERKRTEERIRASLEEKEVLLKEIHHRVKNNLQVISSLLNLQSGYIDDERYAEMFKDSQNRVKSMALVHEKLYQSEDLARIDFAGYIESMVQELRRSYGSERAGIGIKTEVENIRLGVDYAIPCGLIVNELVSNSLKHAFPGGKRGEVKTAMRQVGRNEVELEVSDNGTGLSESAEVRNAKSLGLRLVSILVEDQLRGEMELDRSEGTRFRIRFRVE